MRIFNWMLLCRTWKGLLKYTSVWCFFWNYLCIENCDRNGECARCVIFYGHLPTHLKVTLLCWCNPLCTSP